MISGEIGYLYTDKQAAFWAQQALLEADDGVISDAVLQTLTITGTPTEVIEKTPAYLVRVEAEDVLVSNLTAIARRVGSYLGLAYIIIKRPEVSKIELDTDSRIEAFMIAIPNDDGTFNFYKNRYNDSNVRTNYCTLEFIRELIIGVLQQQRS